MKSETLKIVMVFHKLLLALFFSSILFNSFISTGTSKLMSSCPHAWSLFTIRLFNIIKLLFVLKKKVFFALILNELNFLLLLIKNIQGH